MRLLVAAVPILLLLSPESVAAQAQQAPVDKTSCYAFLRHGDLWTVGQGRRERIDFRGKALDFAVSADGSYFAVQENLEPSGIGRTRQLVVSLTPAPKEEKSRQVDYPESLYATCGTVLSFELVNHRAFDLITSRAIEIPPYKRRFPRLSPEGHREGY
jgi:hypothetical protein